MAKVEFRMYWKARKTTAAVDEPITVTAIPPLLALPGGVTSSHRRPPSMVCTNRQYGREGTTAQPT
jgi:hypothetical protein